MSQRLSQSITSSDDALSEASALIEDDSTWSGDIGYNVCIHEQQFDSFDYIEREIYLDQQEGCQNMLLRSDVAPFLAPSFNKVIIPRTPVKIQLNWVMASMQMRDLSNISEEDSNDLRVSSVPDLWKGGSGYNESIRLQ